MMYSQRYIFFSVSCLALALATTGPGFKALSTLALLALPISLLIAVSAMVFGRMATGVVAMFSTMIAISAVICSLLS